MRMSEAEGKAFLAKAAARNPKIKVMHDMTTLGIDTESEEKPTKYRSAINRVDGLVFRSNLETSFYLDLKRLRDAGEISGFVLQPAFVLLEGRSEANKNILPAITYKADFLVFNNNGICDVIDTKGYRTKEWKRTLKMFNLKFPGLKLFEVQSISDYLSQKRY